MPFSDNRSQPAYYFGFAWRLQEPYPKETRFELVVASLSPGSAFGDLIAARFKRL